MMFVTLCWFLACNESNRIDSFVALNRIESFSLLPNRPSLVFSQGGIIMRPHMARLMDKLLSQLIFLSEVQSIN